jgi:hypothetical protein
MVDGPFSVDLQSRSPEMIVDGNLAEGEFIHALIIALAAIPAFAELSLQ